MHQQVDHDRVKQIHPISVSAQPAQKITVIDPEWIFFRQNTADDKAETNSKYDRLNIRLIGIGNVWR